MRISYITLFPDLIKNYLGSESGSGGLLSKAISKKIIEIEVSNLRDEADGSYKSVDDSPYGGGDGNVIEYTPLKKSLEKIPNYEKALKIYLSPQGKKLDHQLAQKLSKESHLILVSGRYAGIDDRFIQKHIDLEISIGDYVLSGGELGCLVLTEAVSRFIPGVLGKSISAEMDSLSENLKGLLEAPQFTKPPEIDGLKVPDVLMSGHHEKIKNWREKISVLITLKKRPDLFKSKMAESELKQLQDFYKDLSLEEKKNLGLDNMDQEWKKLS